MEQVNSLEDMIAKLPPDLKAMVEEIPINSFKYRLMALTSEVLTSGNKMDIPNFANELISTAFSIMYGASAGSPQATKLCEIILDEIYFRNKEHVPEVIEKVAKMRKSL